MTATQQRTEQQQSLSDNHQAIVTATAALAGAAATYALRKALKRNDSDEHDDSAPTHLEHEEDEGDEEAPDDSTIADHSQESEDEYEDDDRDNDDAPQATNEPVIGSALSGGWHSASHALIPIAEHAAEAAGRWAAKHSPPLVRDHLIPRLIDAFDEAA